MEHVDSHENEQNEDPFYKHAAEYWSGIPATVDGMLGGFGFISNTDIQGSQAFLKQLFKMNEPPGRGHALDCGAGIGRITKHLLIPNFDQVDLVEQDPKFISEAKKYIGPTKKIGQLFNQGLQSFDPVPGTYDIIWCQWVLGHLTDKDFVTFFSGCAKGLKPNGIIVVKENVTSSDSIEVDEQDSSVTRPLNLLHQLFQQSRLQCIKEAKQNNFPRGLYSVKMFALKPV
ncbi:hypothetical protein R5R35_010492 [Gryllus longicercus]|uniref:Alpha N-terminal protein methyltransferase 1 n=1 Tax=Gryllus longicercus TaxID=2509291 RepID=A0AAN9VIZ3_9ORTH